MNIYEKFARRICNRSNLKRHLAYVSSEFEELSYDKILSIFTWYVGMHYRALVNTIGSKYAFEMLELMNDPRFTYITDTGGNMSFERFIDLIGDGGGGLTPPDSIDVLLSKFLDLRIEDVGGEYEYHVSADVQSAVSTLNCITDVEIEAQDFLVFVRYLESNGYKKIAEYMKQHRYDEFERNKRSYSQSLYDTKNSVEHALYKALSNAANGLAPDVSIFAAFRSTFFFMSDKSERAIGEYCKQLIQIEKHYVDQIRYDDFTDKFAAMFIDCIATLVVRSDNSTEAPQQTINSVPLAQNFADLVEDILISRQDGND